GGDAVAVGAAPRAVGVEIANGRDLIAVGQFGQAVQVHDLGDQAGPDQADPHPAGHAGSSAASSIAARSNRAASGTPSVAGTNGSSCSIEMTRAAEPPSVRTRPVHQARSWPRPGTAKVHGISAAGSGQRRSSRPLRARLSTW